MKFITSEQTDSEFSMLLRPALNHSIPEEEQRKRAWEIIGAHGRTSLARYTLLDDKHFFFSTGGSVVSYVVKNRVALALGDPIGPAEDAEAAICQFKLFCSRNHWLPAFYQVSRSFLDSYKRLGFHSVQIGNEAIVDLSTFSLAGTGNGTLRHRYNKMIRLGYQGCLIEPPYSSHMLRELSAISQEWLISHGASELRFLGWFAESYLNTCPVMIVRDRDGFVEAFANVVTEFQANEIHVDLMRQRRQVESGLMDFLFVSLFRWAKDVGYASFNLGMSPLAGVGGHPGDPLLERVFHYIFCNANFYNFRGLYSFKQKFHPAWSPRYLIYPGPASLPLVGISVLKALNANLGIILRGILFPYGK